MTTDKPSRNEDEYFAKRDAELIKTTRAIELARIQEETRKQHLMKCPKDGHDLATQEMQGVQVDLCTHCGGLWLDKGELETLIAHEEHGGVLGRIFSDVRAALGRSSSKERE